jgi:UDP-N-acetylglucosamine--N-acetylmuramyl-(pentapeptide) pyrophosphoryl-undecaprenol N-acetylglucosamine transferase
LKIFLVAGGTGGHIFPAMAVAQEIKVRNPNCRLLWITTDRANEKEIAERFDIEMFSLEVEGIQRKVSLQLIRAVIKLLKSVIFMNKYLKKNRPDAVVAFGGYVCAAVLFAAKSNKIPYFIQEQNTVAGAVNTFFAKKANKIFLGMPLIKNFNADKNLMQITGTPTRKRQNYNNFTFHVSVNKNKRTILICGGSQGAMSMNKLLVKAVKWFSQNDFQVIWQTGTAGEDEIKKLFSGDKNVAVFASIQDLYPYYSIAYLLIGRAGASTISEAQLFALPSILIPLPWSAENHQWHNAQFAQNSGWALCLEQNEKTSEKIIDFVKSYEKDGEIHIKMKNNASKNMINAAEIIAETVLNVE